MRLTNTHHCHVVQHATVHPPLIKLRFILRQANIIQPSWEKRKSVEFKVKTGQEEESEDQQNIGNMVHVLDWQLVLTRHPVVVQLSLIILLLWAEGLQSQLQLLFVQWVFDAQLLNIHQKTCLNTTSPKYYGVSSTARMLCPSAAFSRRIKPFCFISPSPGPVVRPVEASDQRRSTHEPCLHTDPDPAPAASHTPDPLTSVQKEHQHHWEKEMRIEKLQLSKCIPL